MWAIFPKLGGVRFGDECQKWITRHPGVDRTRESCRTCLRAQVEPVLGDRTLGWVAQARDQVTGLLTVRMARLSNGYRAMARALITGTLDEAVLAGKIPSHRCGKIPLADNSAFTGADDFVFPSHAQLTAVARGVRQPLAVWLMRGFADGALGDG